MPVPASIGAILSLELGKIMNKAKYYSSQFVHVRVLIIHCLKVDGDSRS